MVDNETIAKLLKSIEETNKRSIEEANQAQTNDIKGYIKNEITELKIKFESDLKQKTEEYEAKYIEIKANYNKLEKELRKNNIIIFGLETPTEDLPNYVIENLSRLLQIQLSISDINNIYAFGKQTSKRPISVKLTSYLKKQEILKNCKKLKGTPISISEELSLEERKENKILRQHLKKARSKNLNSVIRNKKLIINGQEYTAQQLCAEEEDTEDEESETARNDDNNTEKNQLDSETVHTINQQPKTNSASATPKKIAKKLKGPDETEREEEPDVFETEKVSDSNKRKVVSVSESTNKLRSSSRINSGEKTKIVPQSKTPKKL